MARTVYHRESPDQDAVTLKRVLAGLERVVLDPQSPLMSNKFQRTKITAVWETSDM